MMENFMGKLENIQTFLLDIVLDKLGCQKMTEIDF